MWNSRGFVSGASRALVFSGLAALLASCSSEAGTASGAVFAPASRSAAQPPASGAAPLAAAAIQNPILFVTQVPLPGDKFPSRIGTFANHLTDVSSVPRGGDLMIRYPDGTLRYLTKEAGYGMDGLQLDKAIAVREPSVHWSGGKAIFSMLVGAAPKQFEHPDKRWQLYEVTGLGQGQTAVITKVPNQESAYNNLSPLYASDGRILFTSDRPRGGESHLHPQRDEYESTPTPTGIYSLDPGTGQIAILNHTPSGAFSPTIDSYGRLIFTRWDHLQRDQQAEGSGLGAHNYASEAPGAAKLPQQPETFPESRNGMSSPYGQVNPFTNNLFTPWQMNQDGTGELTLNHIGRQELVKYLPRSFANDPALRDASNPAFFDNNKEIREDAGIFHIRENPQSPGTYFGIYAEEFGEGTTNQIVRFTGAPSLNAEQMTLVDASPPQTQFIVVNGVSIGILPGGRFRNPLPMTSGHMVAAYTPSERMMPGINLRLHQLETDSAGKFVAGNALTPGISKTLSWWSPDVKRDFSGQLWEIEPVEVVARTPPAATFPVLESPEKSVLNEEQIDEATLRNWLKANQLALIVTRNQTSRDRNDRQQPFNLQVPGGVKTTGGGGLVYDIAHYQIFQGNLVRGYDVGSFKGGRRVIAQPMSVSKNPANPLGPAGSVKIASDGSSAAFVPASRALTWQTTDNGGNAIVRERVWVTMQPGEIRTCAGCHGENSVNQAGQATAVNKPEALRQLLRHWKQGNAPTRLNGSQPLIPNRPNPVQPTASAQKPAPVTVANRPRPSGRVSGDADTRR